MNNFFSFEGTESWKPYMPMTKVSPLGPEGLMGGSNKTQLYDLAQQGDMPAGSTAGLMANQQAGGASKKKAKKDDQEDVTRPSATYEPDYSLHEGPNTQDPFNPSNWKYNQESGEYEWAGQETFDPGNYTWDATTNAPKYIGETAWNPERYTGTLYDPSNPFDLTENEWVAMQGALNSGSLFQEGMGLAENANLAGGLSDMGGVGDEIANQAGSGLMSGIGKVLPLLNMAKGAYGLTQGSGGKGGADLAAGIGSYFVPAFGVIKGIWDVAVGLGQYAKSRGRQYDYYHPYLNSQFQGANGSRIMDIGWTDSQSDAAGAGNSQSSYVNQPTALEQFNTPGLASRMNKTMVEKDGKYYYITDIPQYLGMQNYDDYSGRDEISSLVGMGGNENMYPREGLMGEEEYNKYLNDAFINKMTTEGVNFDSPFVQQAQHGMFNGQDVMGTTWNADNANRLVKTWEMAQLLENNNDFMDTSQWLNWQAPEIPQYVAPVPDPNMQSDSTFYGM